MYGKNSASGVAIFPYIPFFPVTTGSQKPMNAYMESLKRRVAEIREQREAALAARANALEYSIRDWYAALPPQQRRPHYAMRDFVLLFRKPPSVLGPTLHKIGFQRSRLWREGGSYARIWIAPWGE
jgi:hypothetical protein